jgi:hypothetical protein
MEGLGLLRYFIIEDNFNKHEFTMCFYDGINYSGSVMGSDIGQSYNNGDKYERIYEKNNDKEIIKVIIKFYEKESNISYSCEKAINSNIIYKKADSVKTEEISKEEYEKLAKAFIKKNDIAIFDLLK